MTSPDNDGKLPSPRVVLYPPDKVKLEWPRETGVGAGLHNMGNTCFLNSTLQCLTYTAPLVNYLFTDDHTNKCQLGGFCMMCELVRHVRMCYKQAGGAVRPSCILHKLRMIAKSMHFGRQEDAHEFLRHVIDAMQRACLNGYQKLDRFSKETTVVNQIFGGFLRSQVLCLLCKSQSNTYDPYMDICLDIKNVPSVQKAMEKFVKIESLDEDNAYNCSKCKKKVPAQKRFSIHKPSNILTVQLKRFAGFFGGKINKHIHFTEQLNLRPYMSQRQGEPIMYSLYGVLVHSGFSCSSGHYYCFVKASNNKWYCMNDSSVHPVGLQRVLGAEAYLLFYVRAQAKKSTQPSPQAQKQPQPSKPSASPSSVSSAHTTNGQSGPKVNGERSQAPAKKSPLAPLSIKTPLKSQNPLKSPPLKSPGMKSPPLKSPGMKSPGLKSPTSEKSSISPKTGSKLVRPIPSPVILPTNPLNSAPTVQGFTPLQKSTPVVNLGQREKVSFGIKRKSSESPQIKAEKPKIVMKISNGKVSYSSISPSGEKSMPVFPDANKVPTKLVAYDDDSSSIESDKESKKSPVAKPVNGVDKPLQNGVNSESKINNGPNSEVSGSKLLENSVKRTEAGSPFKDPPRLLKSLSVDSTFTIPSADGANVNSTTHNWHIADQDLHSPSAASSNGSVNSTTEWHIQNSAERKKARTVAAIVAPEIAARHGWNVTPTPPLSSSSKQQQTVSNTANAIVDDHLFLPKSPKMKLFGKNKSKDDTFLPSTTTTAAAASSAEDLLSFKLNNSPRTFDSQSVTHEGNGDQLSNSLESKMDTVIPNGDAHELTKKEKKRKKKKKKRSHEREEENGDDNEDGSQDEPPRKKHKKKKKKHRDYEESTGSSSNSPKTQNGICESSRSCSSEEMTNVEKPNERVEANTSTEAGGESELEDGEWVEITKDTIQLNKVTKETIQLSNKDKEKVPSSSSRDSSISSTKSSPNQPVSGSKRGGSSRGGAEEHHNGQFKKEQRDQRGYHDHRDYYNSGHRNNFHRHNDNSYQAKRKPWPQQQHQHQQQHPQRYNQRGYGGGGGGDYKHRREQQGWGYNRQMQQPQQSSYY